MRLSLAFALLSALLVLSATGAQAAQRPGGIQPGASCGNTSSAINQYCENIPSATGGSLPPSPTPDPAAPTLATALPQSAVSAYKHLPAATRRRARKLLALPAPAASVPLSASIAAQTSGWSLPGGLVLAMAAIAATGAAAAVLRRRRRRPDDPSGAGSGGSPPTVA